jgi:hypothetical protein
LHEINGFPGPISQKETLPDPDAAELYAHRMPISIKIPLYLQDV